MVADVSCGSGGSALACIPVYFRTYARGKKISVEMIDLLDNALDAVTADIISSPSASPLNLPSKPSKLSQFNFIVFSYVVPYLNSLIRGKKGDSLLLEKARIFLHELNRLLLSFLSKEGREADFIASRLKQISMVQRLLGSLSWSLYGLTKPFIFVIQNAEWTIRYALLSTPVGSALKQGSKNLL